VTRGCREKRRIVAEDLLLAFWGPFECEGFFGLITLS
jgi:hypothetical protein